MSTVQVIKQLEERNVASEISLMVWSDRMDLVALANIKGEVTLHRLTWTKAWSLNPPKDDIGVKGMAWRPDGKILAIAYSNGSIILVKVENKSILHTIETRSDITCINWLQKKSTKLNEDSPQNQYMKNIDLSANFLPEPIPNQFETSADDSQKTNILQDQSDLNLLLIGSADGAIYVAIFGCFPCILLDMEKVAFPCSIQTMHLNEAFDQMYISAVRDGKYVTFFCFDCKDFFNYANELFALALKYIKLTSLLNHLSHTITTITESWENILLEMDNKLSKYASKVPPGGVTADFLDLLMFGICSDEMKAFLVHDLTKKGLEKFGQTIDMSYSNIQKLLLKYVLKFGQNITYHLSEMRGMARFEHRFKILGLQETVINDAILANGGFLIKGGEMQQIINHSIINYKAFFRWLYTAIVHVLEEQVPNELPKMTQQDLAYITEFLQNFDSILTEKGFIMERLCQYLTDAHLTIEPQMSNNEWSIFLEENECVQKHPSILQHNRQMSLIQQYQHLHKCVKSVFETPCKAISERIILTDTLHLFEFGAKTKFRASQINVNATSTLVAFSQSQHVSLLQFFSNRQRKDVQLYFSIDSAICDVIDFQLYSSVTLSVLLQTQSQATILCQIPIGPALEKLTMNSDRQTIQLDGMSLLPRVLKTVEGMLGAELAVSGSRKVGIVLAENRRKVRLYEMEGEEEEDEDAEMSTLRESSDLNITCG